MNSVARGVVVGLLLLNVVLTTAAVRARTRTGQRVSRPFVVLLTLCTVSSLACAVLVLTA